MALHADGLSPLAKRLLGPLGPGLRTPVGGADDRTGRERRPALDSYGIHEYSAFRGRQACPGRMAFRFLGPAPQPNPGFTERIYSAFSGFGLGMRSDLEGTGPRDADPL